MYKPSNHGGGVLLAALAAGPLLASTTFLAATYLALPQAIPVRIESIPFALGVLAFSLIPGMIVGLPLNGLGTFIMTHLAERFAYARSAAGWTVVGGLAGLGIAWLLTESREFPIWAFGLVVTSAACAWLCQYPIEWSEGEEQD